MIPYFFSSGLKPPLSKKGNLISRRRWQAADPQVRDELGEAARKVVIHHTALWTCTKPSECQAQLTYIQKMHMEDRGFSDIGYNFLIGGDGAVYEGRGWGIIGAHAKTHNLDSVGIAFMGNFNDEFPSPAALSSLQRLLYSGVAQGHLYSNFVLLAHRDLAHTECPGEHLYSSLQRLKSQRAHHMCCVDCVPAVGC
ncbi:peptidoglycan recognition protein 5 [Chanos chanos]|uniref:Peptidoglycan-recognition protein n=1 Tax=Chanos chanos TaxID=29144 RepID=A0A6J2ULW8_CHACN|nr:peptidoglycan-recognition protein SC2-like [Chanos chanos]